MAENNNDKLVIAYYVNAAAAEAAADDLKDWDGDNDDVKLGAIGIITLNRENGKIEVDEIGQRNVKKGALWGTAIGAGLGILTAGIALIPGLIAGAALGAGAGALDHRSLGMTDEDVERLAAHLKNGGAALGVMADDFEVVATTAKMVEFGGKSEHYELIDEAKEAVEDAVAEQQAEAEEDTAAAEAAAFGAALGLGDEKAESLLELGATPKGREELADETGFPEDVILVAVQKMDLLRIDGVGIVYANLLHTSGVDSIPELAQRNPDNLAEKLDEVNKAEQIADDNPSAETVAGWVKQAKDLPRAVEY